MYKYDNGQISLQDFCQPVGIKLKEDNRWVKKAQTIPWCTIEERYASLFSRKKGNVAKPLRLGLGAYIIQSEYGFSDVRGKAKIPVEFGAKLDISVCDGWTRLEVLSFEAYNESGGLFQAHRTLFQANTGRQNLP